MPKVDFYIAGDQQPQAAELLACRIAEKAVAQGHRAFLRTRDEAQAHGMDTLLWTFRDGSFLPHGLWDGDPGEPIVIGPAGVSAPDDRDLLINLAEVPLDSLGSWQRIADVADQSPERLRAARQRFRWYRDQGVEPQHHTVG
ncbi:MAG: DNA polymerase III subunit chi [Ectothiorhodospiraceae bacterium]|nr:DNA polymerase III subunit chi [Ectothiorhodospiraceae bacterium]MCH8503101.1 DNA polymerase III subunit chi [Ectothiorhodospiraceae bacterium]